MSAKRADHYLGSCVDSLLDGTNENTKQPVSKLPRLLDPQQLYESESGELATINQMTDAKTNNEGIVVIRRYFSIILPRIN